MLLQTIQEVAEWALEIVGTKKSVPFENEITVFQISAVA
jgi:hypothetical protein